MLIILLNILGLLLIIMSLILIKLDLKSEDTKYDQLTQLEESVKEYYNMTEDILENFDNIIDTKMEELTKLENQDKYNQIKPTDLESDQKVSITYEEVKPQIEDKRILNPTAKKILELQEIGLTKEEIGKQLNKGISEIDIILKLYNK